MSDGQSLTAVSSDRIGQYVDDIQLMYDDVEYSIEQLTRYGEPVIFKGAPGVGKTTSLFKVAQKKNEPITYLAARHDMYEAARQKALEAGFDEDEIAIVPSPFRSCPTLMGAHGDSLGNEYRNLYSVGVTAAYLHHTDSIRSPCHSDTTTCPYMVRRIDDPDEYKVIIGHYKHALNDKLIENRLTFVDEFAGDDSVTRFTPGGEDDTVRIGKALNGYFDYADFLPWGSVEHLIARLSAGAVDNPTTHAANIAAHPHGGETDGLVIAESELMEMDRDKRFHKMAPTIVFGLLMTEDLGNGWDHWHPFPGLSDEPEFSKLSEDIVIARNDPDNLDNLEINMLEPTDLGAASQIIGLDGTARKAMWNTIFKQDFAVKEFIGPDQMPKYVRDVQDMDLWISTYKARPYSSARDIYEQANASTILYTKLALDRPTVITAKKAARELEDRIPRTFDEDVRPVSIKTPDGHEERNVMNFASVRSNNEAAGTEAICILGSPHPGDDVIERWGALMGVGVERVDGTEGTSVQYEPDVGQEIYGHFVLDTVEQCIMRGRRGDGDESGATVVTGTGCLPYWLRDTKIDVKLSIGDDSPFSSEARREIIRYLADQGESTSRELDEMTELCEEARRRFINQLDRKEWLTSDPQPGPKPTEYIWRGPCQ